MSVESVNRKSFFNNITVNKEFSISNKTIMNIFSNFVPNKLVTFNDNDCPWVNDFIKNQIKWQQQIYKTYIKMVVKTLTMLSFKHSL